MGRVRGSAQCGADAAALVAEAERDGIRQAP